jgi:hypothetical protein
LGILLDAHSNKNEEWCKRSTSWNKVCRWHWGYHGRKDVKVGVIGQQLEDSIALAPNGNIKEGM